MMNKGEVLTKVYKRVEFLLDNFPNLENVLQSLQTEIDERGLKYASMPEVFKMYQSIFGYYNKSLDTIKSILVYFPLDMSAEQKELNFLYASLDQEGKESVMKLAKAIHDNTVASKFSNSYVDEDTQL